jgi:hypothetical protein
MLAVACHPPEVSKTNKAETPPLLANVPAFSQVIGQAAAVGSQSIIGYTA